MVRKLTLASSLLFVSLVIAAPLGPDAPRARGFIRRTIGVRQSDSDQNSTSSDPDHGGNSTTSNPDGGNSTTPTPTNGTTGGSVSFAADPSFNVAALYAAVKAATATPLSSGQYPTKPPGDPSSVQVQIYGDWLGGAGAGGNSTTGKAPGGNVTQTGGGPSGGNSTQTGGPGGGNSTQTTGGDDGGDDSGDNGGDDSGDDSGDGSRKRAVTSSNTDNSSVSAFTFVADMDIDCDGEDYQCSGNPDGQPLTSFGALDARVVPWFVIPDNFTEAHTDILQKNALGAVICDGKMFYGIYGDQNGDDPRVIGEASLIMGQTCFPDANVNGAQGHDPADVAYIVFGNQVPTGVGNNTIDIAALKTLGDTQVRALMQSLGIDSSSPGSSPSNTTGTG